MNTIKVAVLVGSLRKGSFNRRLAHAVEGLMPADFHFDYVSLGTVPLYNQDFDGDYPAAATELKHEIEAADAVLFVTPEYNRGVPGVLKNALDVASRPWGTNSFGGKPGAVIGASIGATGSALAQQHLRNSLVFLDIAVMAQPEVFVQFKDDGPVDADGNITNEGTKKFLQGFADRYAAWVRHHLKK